MRNRPAACIALPPRAARREVLELTGATAQGGQQSGQYLLRCIRLQLAQSGHAVMSELSPLCECRAKADMNYRQAVAAGFNFPIRHPHIALMTQWQKSFTREPPKTKAELREMLAEAVRKVRRDGQLYGGVR
jgi:hypothetical protein